MEGAIFETNPDLGIVAVDTRVGYTIFEHAGPQTDFEIGDHVQWSPDAPLGAHPIENRNRGRTHRVYFQNHRVPGTFLKVNLHP